VISEELHPHNNVPLQATSPTKQNAYIHPRVKNINITMKNTYFWGYDTMKFSRSSETFLKNVYYLHLLGQRVSQD
jgi:hypothetical protein